MQNNLPEMTVTELSAALKRTVEERFGLVRVRGEISGFRGAHSSGHCYFSLKDDRARLEAVIWKGSFSRIGAKLQEGLEVIATGKLTTFPGSSKYQIVIETIEPAGIGALMALLEERKKKLAAEGLFAPERKQLLPYLPLVIGVVTSPTGAVIRDVLHRIADRFPLHVIVWPVRVQGDASGAEVAAAIRGFNALAPGGPVKRPDLLIVARGGGSIEDLWGFNDEDVVRAAADSAIPLISAVGHETDWTLIDHAADIRAPTPTGAAEMAVPVKADIEAHVATLTARLGSCLRRGLERARSDLRAAQRGLGTPDAILAQPRQLFDTASARLGRALELAVSRKRQSFSRAEGRLGRGAVEQRTRYARQSLDRLGRRLASRLVERSLSTSRDALERAATRGLRAQRANLERARHRLDLGWRLIENLSHKRVLDRGFALVLDAQGKAVTSAAAVQDGQQIGVQMRDGSFAATVGDARSRPPATRRSAGSTPSGQGSLF